MISLVYQSRWKEKYDQILRNKKNPHGKMSSYHLDTELALFIVHCICCVLCACMYVYTHEHFLPADTHTFRKIWRALFYCNTRFEIRPLALLSTNYVLSSIRLNKYKPYFKFILMLAEDINLNPDR